MRDKNKVSPIFARLSLGLATIPVGFYFLLMTSGGSEGFGVWNDIVLLLVVALFTAVLGLILSGFSSKRNEKSKTNVSSGLSFLSVSTKLAHARPSRIASSLRMDSKSISSASRNGTRWP